MADCQSYRFASLARRLVIFSIAFMLATCADGAEPEVKPPERYVLDYPLAERFCPPVETYFDDVSQAIQKVGGKTIRHQLNGGYGQAVVDKIGDQNVLHLGADVAWTQPGVAVHAIANGVVRLSQGAPTPEELKKIQTGKITPNQASGLAWGNLIVIEHKLPGGKYITSIYGHLSNRRLVAPGDIVQAGQVIGFEGRKGLENGGYTPHLHLGLRDGRMFEEGMEFAPFEFKGKATKLKLVHVDEKELELACDNPELTTCTLGTPERNYPITTRDGKLWAPSALLNAIPAPSGFAVGYGLTTEGWLDPTNFLARVSADVAPAPFGPVPRTVAAKPAQ